MFALSIWIPSKAREGWRGTASFELMKRRRGRDKAHHHCSRTKRDEGRNEHMVLSAPDGARPLPCYHPLGSAPLPHARRLILQITSMHGENTAAATTASLLPPSQLRGERELTRQRRQLFRPINTFALCMTSSPPPPCPYAREEDGGGSVYGRKLLTFHLGRAK